MKYRTLLFALMLMFCTFVKAHDFRVDGIYYNITDANSRSVEVTFKGETSGQIIRNDYKNSIVQIPYSVTYDGIDYTVTRIGDYAFQNCKNIMEVSIPNSVTSIGSGAFSLCDNLSEIEFSENIYSIGGGAFAWTDWFDEQPSGLLYIGKVLYAYKGKMPENTKIAVKLGTKTIQAGIFDNQSNLVAVTLPYGLTNIGENAFRNCDFLNNIEIPNTVMTIGSSAFEGCEDLESVKMSEGIKDVGSKAFYNCDRLASITIPGGTIGRSAFEGCKRLKTVKLGDEVTCIEHYAFAQCAALTSVTIGSGVKSIKDAFNGCTNLSAVYIRDIATWCAVDFYYSSDHSSNPLNYAGNLYLNGNIVVDMVIPDGVTEINNYVFEGCSSIVSVTIPNSVMKIGQSAFRGCSNLKTVYNYSNLSKGLNNYGNVAYYADKVINAPNGSIEGDFVFGNVYGVSTLVAYLGNATELVLPENYKGESYTIGANVFEDNQTLTNITIPNSVTSIGKDAFSGCSELKAVYISDLSAWCNIDFANIGSNPLCRQSKLYLNGVLLTDLVVPDGVTEIKRFAFYDYKFSTVTIPSSVISIANDAFYQYTNIHISDLAAWCNIDFGDRITPMVYKDRLYLNGKKVTKRKLRKYYNRSRK